MIPKFQKCENVVLQISLDLFSSGLLIFHPNRFDVVDGVPIILHGMNRILGIASHCTFPHQHLAHCAVQHNVGIMYPWWPISPRPILDEKKTLFLGHCCFFFYVKKLIKIRAQTWTQEVHGEKIASSSFTSKPASKYGSGRFLSSCKRNVSALYARQSSGLAISNHEFPEQTT